MAMGELQIFYIFAKILYFTCEETKENIIIKHYASKRVLEGSWYRTANLEVFDVAYNRPVKNIMASKIPKQPLKFML